MSDARSKRLTKYNIWAGRIVPVIVLGALIYTLYCGTYQIAIRYLLRPNRDYVPSRHGAAVAIIVLQYVLATILLATWGRFLQAVIFNPGYVPKGKRPKAQKLTTNGESETRRQRSRSRSTRRSRSRESSPSVKFLDREAVRDGILACPPGLEQFYRKEVFISGIDGVPRFCNACWNWKPDRTHHSSELNRCVKRYDHYCPWVGGAVSETNYKFFLQTAFYTLLYCIFLFVICVWTLTTAKSDCRKSTECFGSGINGHWIASIAVACIFGLMAFGIVVRFGSYAIMNITTIEDLQRISPRHCLAIRIDESELPRRTETIGADAAPEFHWVKYPFPKNYSADSTGKPTEPPVQSKESFYYAIIPPAKGDSPWDLGSGQNWRAVMGVNVWDWFLPIRYSPHMNHDDPFSEFEFGYDFTDMEKSYFPHRYDERGRRKTSRGTSRRRRKKRSTSRAEEKP